MSMDEKLEVVRGDIIYIKKDIAKIYQKEI